MKFTLSWLKEHLKTDKTGTEIAECLNAIGLEVEEIKDLAKIYEPFIVAEIIEAEKHPNAEKLRMCKVNNGKEILQIVCAAANARAGIKVVLATIGTYIPSNGLTIKHSQIRGVDSQGMMCSGAELELSSDADGIIELPAHYVVGEKFCTQHGLDDVIIEIAITPNRGDATSVLGVARDLAAKGAGELIKPDPKGIKVIHDSSFKIENSVADLCYQFYGTVVSNIDNTKQVESIRNKLAILGSGHKSALVDISNYAMLAYGRPNHMYDLDKIDGNLQVRLSKDGEEFVAIGGEKYILPEGIMVIADNKSVCCLAGVIGGEHSKVDSNTKNIVVEFALFCPEAVAKAGRYFNIITDARYRFERRVDTGFSDTFNNIIINLIVDELGGQPAKTIKINGNMPEFLKEVKYDFAYFKRLAGIELSKVQQLKILASLGFDYENDMIIVPSYRYGDIATKQDIVEEVLRIYGFDNIESIEMPAVVINYQNRLDSVRRRLVNRAMDEVVTWSFYSAKRHALFSFENGVVIDNPVSTDLSTMRRSLIATIIDSIDLNVRRGNAHLAFFDIGKVYESIDLEENVIAGIRYGNDSEPSVFKNRSVDFYDAKADCFAAIDELGFDPTKLQYYTDTPSYYHPGRSMVLKLGKFIVAYVGELHPSITQSLKLDGKLVGFELFYDKLPISKQKAARSKLHKYEFQPVERDFAFLLNDEVDAFEIYRTIKVVDQNLIEQVKIFDVFKDEKLGVGKKSVAVRVLMQPKDKTLNDDEIQAVCSKVISTVQSKLSGVLRV